MRKGDLLLFNQDQLGMYGTVMCDPYSKPVWGSSGHHDDIAIVSMITVLLGPHWAADAGKIKRYRYSHLSRISGVVQ
jgi:hypothetical protein